MCVRVLVAVHDVKSCWATTHVQSEKKCHYAFIV